MKHATLTAIAVLITCATAHAEAVLVAHSAVYAVPVKSPLFAGTVTQGELQELRFVTLEQENPVDGSPGFKIVPIEGPLQGYTLQPAREKKTCMPKAEIFARMQGEMPASHVMLALPRGAHPRELTSDDRKRLHPKLCASNAIAYDVGQEQVAICASAANKLVVAKRRGQAAWRIEETFSVPAECP